LLALRGRVQLQRGSAAQAPAINCAAAAAAEGDTLRTWRIDPYLMIEGGQAWLPPPMLAADLAAGERGGSAKVL
jgi:hypothetical protein